MKIPRLGLCCVILASAALSPRVHAALAGGICALELSADPLLNSATRVANEVFTATGSTRALDLLYVIWSDRMSAPGTAPGDLSARLRSRLLESQPQAASGITIAEVDVPEVRLFRT